ncbi:superoxide dismutase [Mesobacillus zeae]|uniref:superoxide dismutase n=1 Tax=Mesobacillus zeae TaxID=1917180 RepID=A0A398BD17_9BACI|nr:superoxide dismutase [Mesobacillus zeae]RID85556.1 superoxide dismutase [Mesobacillus zeae]
MKENSYRESLAEWCEEISFTWESALGQPKDLFDDTVQKHWCDRLFLLKKEAEADNNMSDTELYNKAAALHDELTSILSRDGRHEDERVQPVPVGGHRLPSLPYRYDALEPVISEEIMRLHHLKHHQTYVDGLNKAEKEMQKARENGDFGLIKHWEREAAFHGSGHYLHTIFWSNMSPDGGGEPSGQLSQAIKTAFGSFEKFKKHFSEAAKNVEAVGWAILVWAPRSHRLEILTAEKHQNLTQWDVIPLLVLDVWEHAYYLQYKNERAKYVEQWWKVVNWRDVGKRFKEAKTIMWQPY